MSFRSLVTRAWAFVARPLAIFTLSAMFAAAAHAGVVRLVSGGILTGATGVDVGGVLYDVSFQDGTCAQLFSGCDSADDFVFTTAAAATAASQALLSQVFLDTADGSFDSNPTLTRGCSSPDICYSDTPYALESDGWARVASAANRRLLLPDVASTECCIPPSADYALFRQFTFAVWSPAAPVPEPSSLALLGVAGVALGWSQRRRRLRATDRTQ